jgi:hypothetical protein
VTFIAPETGFATQRDVNRTKRDIKTFAIKVALDNPEHRLHSGMTAYVLLPASPPAPVALSARQAASPPPATLALSATRAPAATLPPPVTLAPAATPPRPAAPPAAPVAVPATLPPAPRPATSPAAVAPVIANVTVPSLPVTRPAVPVTLPSVPTETRLATKAVAPAPLAPAGVMPAAAFGKLVVPALPMALPAAARAPRLEPGLPRLSLEAISIVNGKPVAMINKQKLVAGETISGARVIRILDYQVELEYQGRRFAIGL